MDFISITRNVDLEDILQPEGGVIQNDYENWIRISQIKILFLILGFQKRIVSNQFKKYTRAISLRQLIFEYKMYPNVKEEEKLEINQVLNSWTVEQ